MTLLFFIILTAAWLLIFFPKLLGARRRSPLPAAEMFKKRLELLAPHPAPRGGRAIYLPQDPEQARRDALRRAVARKRKVFAVLLGVTVASGTLALLWPVLWRVHLAGAGLLFAYVAILVGSRRRRDQALAKVERLPSYEPIARRAGSRRASGGAR